MSPTHKPGYIAVYYTPLTAPGGVAQVIRNLLQAAAGEWNPLLHLIDWERPTAGFTPDPETGIVTWRFPMAAGINRAGQVSWRTLAGFLLRLVPTLRQLAKQLRAVDARMVHLHGPELSAVHYVLLRRWGRLPFRLIYTLHGTEVTEAAAARGWRKTVWSWILRQCDGGAAVSEALREQLVASYPELRNCRVILNGVPVEAVRQAAAGCVLPPRPPGMLFTAVGAFRQVKGYDVLLEAFAQLRQQGLECSLELIGTAGEWSAEVRVWIRERGLENVVTVRENVPHAEALAHLARADAVVLPSRREGLSVVLLEAGALGRAVVATRVGGTPRVIEDGCDGLLVPPEDPEALAAAMRQVTVDAALRQRLGQALRQKVEERFTATSAWQQYVSLFGS